MWYLSEVDNSFAELGQSAGVPAIAYYVLGGIITVAAGLMVLRSIVRGRRRK